MSHNPQQSCWITGWPYRNIAAEEFLKKSSASEMLYCSRNIKCWRKILHPDTKTNSREQHWQCHNDGYEYLQRIVAVYEVWVETVTNWLYLQVKDIYDTGVKKNLPHNMTSVRISEVLMLRSSWTIAVPFVINHSRFMFCFF